MNQELSTSNGSMKTIGLIALIVVALVSAISLTRWLDARRPAIAEAGKEDESLYLNPNTARRMSLAFNGLAADWYWMRSLQYVGRKIMAVPEDVVIDDLQMLNLKLLAPLLDTATTLDPEFYEPYEYAAVVLPSIDVQQAIRITQKGIAANPTDWRLYHQLGYIYWQQKNFQGAAESYDRGSQISGAPLWMSAMRAQMANAGGSRSTAREIYKQMYESNDETVRETARRRLMQLDSFDEREAFNKLLLAYQSRTGRCPANWKEFEPVLRTLGIPLAGSGAPFDPSGTPYVLKGCEVDLDPQSIVPTK
jgi:tetratricopeptide (TPR) repeat protein